MIDHVRTAWQWLKSLALVVGIVLGVWAVTLQTMFLIVVLSVLFDFDLTAAEYCADVVGAVLQTDEDLMENARRVWGRQK